MLILQQDDIRDREELINAIHNKHENCQLDNEGVEKNVIRIIQSCKHTLWGEIFGSFELGRVDICGIICICPHLPYPIVNGQK